MVKRFSGCGMCVASDGTNRICHRPVPARRLHELRYHHLGVGSSASQVTKIAVEAAHYGRHTTHTYFSCNKPTSQSASPSSNSARTVPFFRALYATFRLRSWQAQAMRSSVTTYPSLGMARPTTSPKHRGKVWLNVT